jgi:hypothetical protein
MDSKYRYHVEYDKRKTIVIAQIPSCGENLLLSTDNVQCMRYLLNGKRRELYEAGS